MKRGLEEPVRELAGAAFRAPRGQMRDGVTQAMSVYIVEERQRSICPRAAGTRRAHGGCGRSLRCSPSTMYNDIASSSRLDFAAQAPCARPLLMLGRAPKHPAEHQSSQLRCEIPSFSWRHKGSRPPSRLRRQPVQACST